jgi:hypothetical protein
VVAFVLFGAFILASVAIGWFARSPRRALGITLTLYAILAAILLSVLFMPSFVMLIFTGRWESTPTPVSELGLVAVAGVFVVAVSVGSSWLHRAEREPNARTSHRPC